MLKDYQDAYGHEVYDYFTNKGGYEIVERDDGFIDVSGGPKAYLADYNDWPSHQKKAMRYVRGKVLDIGCGAGRHSRYLQKKDFDVLGLDVSPLAVEVCKLSGLKEVKVMSISEVNLKLGTFNTILMLGNNFGLFGSFERAKRLLKRFYKITSEKGRIIAESNDPYKTEIPEHLEYHNLNRQRGRMPGQLKIKVRYKKYATSWFDYLLVSKEEMAEILNGTGWKVKKFINSELSTALVGALYPAIGVETIGRLPPISMKDHPYGFPKTTSHHATGRKGHSSPNNRGRLGYSAEVEQRSGGALFLRGRRCQGL